MSAGPHSGYRSGVLRVGLLQCDDLDPPHREVDGGYLDQFSRLLALGGLSGGDVDIVVFRADHGELPVPGSHQGVCQFA